MDGNRELVPNCPAFKNMSLSLSIPLLVHLKVVIVKQWCQTHASLLLETCNKKESQQRLREEEMGQSAAFFHEEK